LRDGLVAGLVLCGVGGERLLNAHLAGPLAFDITTRFSTGLFCTATGLAVLLASLWARRRETR
jgi:hypothetical protein